MKKKFGGKQKKRTFAIPKRKGGLRKAPRCAGETEFEVHFELMSRRTSEEGRNLLE